MLAVSRQVGVVIIFITCLHFRSEWVAFHFRPRDGLLESRIQQRSSVCRLTRRHCLEWLSPQKSLLWFCVLKDMATTAGSSGESKAPRISFDHLVNSIDTANNCTLQLYQHTLSGEGAHLSSGRCPVVRNNHSTQLAVTVRAGQDGCQAHMQVD